MQKQKLLFVCHGITKASEAAGGHKFVVAGGVRWWTKKVLPFYYA